MKGFDCNAVAPGPTTVEHETAVCDHVLCKVVVMFYIITKLCFSHKTDGNLWVCRGERGLLIHFII